MERLLTECDKESTDMIELEIRYKDIELATIENLLFYTMKQYDVTHETFIDSIDYTETTKIGLRTFLKDGKKVKTEGIHKESITKVMDHNPIGKYSVNISYEKKMAVEDAPKDPANIILKHRYSYLLPKHKDWRVDITISKKSELTSAGIKNSVQMFFNSVKSPEDLFMLLKKKRFNFTHQIEIESVGSIKKLTPEIIKDIAILPFKMVDSDIEMKLNFSQELEFVKQALNGYDASTIKRLLPSIRTITHQQYDEIYPPLDYLLTDKRDGKRTLLTVHDGVLSLLSDKEKIIRHKVKYDKVIILEGETVNNDLLIIYDAIVVEDRNLAESSIEDRFALVPKAINILKKLLPQLEIKEATYFALTNPQRYKNQFEDMYKVDKGYDVDGLILVKKGDSYLNTTTYKWKPIESQTIDFYVRRCPNDLLGKNHFMVREGHTLYILFVGASVQMINNLRLPYVEGYKSFFNIPYSQTYKPIPFSTPLVPLSYLYYHPDSSGSDNEDLDGQVLEMICDSDYIQYVNHQYIVNWKIKKSRKDKVVLSGKEYGNNYVTAFSSFMNIIDPFPLEYLYQGSPPSELYYKNTGAENNTYSATRALMSYIKSQLISEYAHKANRVLDLASGRGADLRRYIQLNSIGTVVVSDINKAAITELFGRWLDISRKSRTMINSSLRGVIMDINDPAEGNIARITSLIESSFFNTIFCHNALHHFIESLESIHNLAKLCSGLTIAGSHVVFTCPNGEAIFKKIGKNENWTGIEDDRIKYKYERLYTGNNFEASGQKIKVLLPFSNGELYGEYLINISTIEKVFGEYKLKLIVNNNADSYFDAFEIHQRSMYERLTPLDKENMALYSVLVFKRE